MDRILVVDKSASTYARISGLLSTIGYSITQAVSYENAQQSIITERFYAIFIALDTISDISDIEYILNISKPYSIITLYGDEKYQDVICQAIDLGVDDFFRTPFNDQIFLTRSRNMIARINNLRDAHARSLYSLVDFLPVMMLITDGYGKIITANSVALSKFGKTINQVKDRMIGEFLTCDNALGNPLNCHHNCGKCKIAEMEHEVLTVDKKFIRKEVAYNQIKNGTPHKKSIRVSMAPITYDNRRLVIINLEDVTFERNAFDVLSSTIDNLRKSYDDSQDQVKISSDLADYLQQINDNLQTEKNKLEMLFDNMTSGFMLLRKKGDDIIFEDGNNKLSEMFNTNIEQFFGAVFERKPEYVEPELYDAIKTVFETGKSMKFNMNTERFKGSFSISIYKPEPDYVAVLLNDITDEVKSHRENKELTRQLKKQNLILDDKNEELKKAIETKNKFISIIAHDLKNPFNAINGLSELLMKRLSPDNDQRAVEMARIIHDSAKGAYELLENLLVWARTQQNTIQFQPEGLNIHNVTAETINEIKVQAEKKHIMIINQTETRETIWADKQMLQTIIRNITSNAIKFTNEGGLIVIGSQQTDTGTEITIEDNGVGMTQETMEKLMTVSKNKSTKGTAGETGSGMGLLISKEFIEKHNGTIVVESELGMGSKFIITFPNNDENGD